MLGVSLRGTTWLRLHEGVYVRGPDFVALPPWKRYAVRVHEFARTHPDAVFCLESAAVLHGIPHFGEVAMVDAVISHAQGGMLRADDLHERGRQQQNQRGRARLRWACENADARSESVAESVSRAVIMWSGFEHPEPQKQFFYEGHNDRVDFFFPSCGAVGESDGWGKYDLDDPARAERHLRDEKRREERLRRHGHPFARWDQRDAWKVPPMCNALAAARMPQISPPHSLMLATLRSNPRARSMTGRENRFPA